MGTCMSTEDGMTNVGRRQPVMARNQLRHVKKRDKEALTIEGQRDLLLALTPGRMFRIGASGSACTHTQQGRKGCNQDAMLVWEKFASMNDTVFCGVFDGHGPFGHLVARRIRDSLPSKLVAFWHDKLTSIEKIEGSEMEALGNGESTHTDHESNLSTSRELSSEEFLGKPVRVPPPMFEPWRESHLKAFEEMDKELRTHPAIDSLYSGSTTVTVLKQGQHLVVGNVGDSRAIMGTLDDNGSWKAAQLTVDLKPSLPSMVPSLCYYFTFTFQNNSHAYLYNILLSSSEEAERIRKCSGRVFALHDEPEIMRVWLPFEDSPGLAMARAFGDFCLKDYGVIAVPEITYCQVTDRDKFIILATDGIWDVLSNEEAVQIIATAPTRATAARSLVESAVRVWRLKYPASKVDDCAVVCLYLDRATDEDMFTEASALMSKESLPTSLLITPQNQSDVGVECVSMTTPVQEIRKIDLSSGKSQDAGVQEIGETLNSEEENAEVETSSSRIWRPKR
ncbi:probable protein phosphatase 2C 33 isoform X3 [Physcomitrium patens]|uniref:probable protein phosphatase 2C 33 isoform X3 n=1 Tax=Physcomitrium patens TaxID=3218 RepID=UPI000D166146|nr:probable protein phosphatase 2C 33 isoform X3 [Physcomitrium patens]|eukprot:XP_024368356.1 probable protein phosphatase 2C 33 isoform X3 [Physcomitrella patens]